MISVNSLRLRDGCLIVTLVCTLLGLAGCGTPAPRQESRRSRPVSSAPGASPYTAYPPSTLRVIPAPSVVHEAPALPGGVCDPAPVSAVAQGNGKTVILDAGHGGHDTGASHYGLNEKDINLDLARRTAGLLRARGCTVIMTRSSDTFVPLQERSNLANRYPNATLVSIHVNAAEDNPGVTGIETFVLSSEHSDTERGRIAANRFRANGMDSVQGKQALANLAVQSRSRGNTLAACLQSSLCGKLSDQNRGVKQKDLHVLRETYFGPAALVEVGFLTNPGTARRMATAQWRQRTSEALADGIGRFLNHM